MTDSKVNPLAQFFKDLALNVNLFPQAEYLQYYFAAQVADEQAMTKRKAEKFMNELAAIKRPLNLVMMADAFKKLCALALPRKKDCVCWGYHIDKTLFNSWLEGISVFLPGYFDGDTIHHRVAADALALVCGNLATLQDGEMKAKAYKLMPKKDALFKTAEVSAFRADPAFSQRIAGFSREVNLYYAPFVVIALCAALA